MAIVLPKSRIEPVGLSPAILLLWGPPKVGKTEILSQLEDNLVIELEKGMRRYGGLYVEANNYQEMQDVLVALAEEYQANGNKPLRKYGSVDPLDVLEDYAVHKAAELYKQTPMGKAWYAKNYTKPGQLKPDGDYITNLPNGGGWGYVREAMQWYIDVLSKFFGKLILIGHVKDKKINATEGAEELTVKDVALTGKLAWIIPAKVDAVGYLYRNAQSELMVSFKTREDKQVMGSRSKHLAGQVFPFDWSKIYID